jgi:FKBP-type peptidyl-prolyl cis-trans isomerase FklB
MHLYALSAAAGLLLSIGTCLAAEPPKLEQEADRINYSLGHQIGTDFKRQGIDLDSDAIVRGIEDALADNAPLLDKKEMDSRLGKLKGQITEDMRADQLQRVKERKAEAERKRQEAQAFLEENASKPGVQTLTSGLQYKVISEGTGDKPTALDEVTIHYQARKIDGRVYDNSTTREKPRTMRVADMIPGLKEGIQMMQPGAKWELYIPPDLAYGRKSPLAHQVVIIEMELLSVGSQEGGTTDTGSETPNPGGKP